MGVIEDLKALIDKANTSLDQLNEAIETGPASTPEAPETDLNSADPRMNVSNDIKSKGDAPGGKQRDAASHITIIDAKGNPVTVSLDALAQIPDLQDGQTDLQAQLALLLELSKFLKGNVAGLEQEMKLVNKQVNNIPRIEQVVERLTNAVQEWHNTGRLGNINR
jgi:hypothetical protein